MDTILQDRGCKSTENQPAFWKNTLPPSSVSKNKPSKKPAWSRKQQVSPSACYLLHADFLLGIFFNKERGDMYL
jgi:hypothetical protein